MKEDFIKAALLGTDKFVPNYSLVGTDLPVKISEQSGNKEDVFLKQAAVMFTYQEAGGAQVEQKELKDLAFSGEKGTPLDSKIEDLLRYALKNNDTVLTRFLSEKLVNVQANICLLYTSPSPRDATLSRMPSSA